MKVFRNISADRESIEQLVGQRLGSQYIQNPAVSVYGVVLVFKQHVVKSNQLLRALDKHAGTRILAVAPDFTVEARQLAAQIECDLFSDREFGWTDDRRQEMLARKQRS